MNFLFHNRRLFLLLVVGVTLLFGYFLPNVLPVNFSFESFFPRDDEYAFYNQYRETFGSDDNGVFVAFEAGEKGIFEREFLLSVDSILDTLAAFEYIDSVISPCNLSWFKRTPMDIKRMDMLDLSSQEKLDKTRSRLEEDPFFSRTFLSKDKKYIGAIVLLDPKIANGNKRNVVCNRIQDQLNNATIKTKISGVPYIRTQLVEKINAELIMFVGGSYLLILAFLIFIYRSFWGVLIPLAGVIGALIWCLGFMGMLDTQIDIINNLLPPIMFVVGMADIIHMITKYSQELKSGKTKEQAMRATLSSIGSAILLTSITTAIGFASLVTSGMIPMRNFGLFAAAGVMFAYLIAIVLIPNALMWVRPEKLIQNKGFGERRIWENLLTKVERFARHRPRAIALGFLAITIAASIGMSFVSLNSYIVDDLREGDPVRQNLYFFENNFHGIRPFELAIMPEGDRKVTDLEILMEMEKIEGFLAEREKFSPFFSPVSFVKNAHQILKYNGKKHYRLPKNQEKVEEIMGMAYASGSAALLSGIVSEDLKMGRISAQMKDIGTDNFAVLKKDLETYIDGNCNLDLFSYRLTGNAYIYSLNIGHLHRSVFYGLAFAFVVIGFLMGGIFRSFKMVLIALVPNIIPLLLTAGLMGFTGIGLKASTSVVFVISFGIAVDVTIHFLSRLRIELRAHGDMDVAIKNTIHGTGKALIITSTIIMSGFVLFLTSNLGGTFAIGLFVTVTLGVGLVSNLLLIPVIVRWAFKGKYAELSGKRQTGE